MAVQTRTLYVVMGMTGEYSDRHEWPVRAFIDLVDAETLVVKASARAREIEIKKTNPRVSEFDPQFRMDYTGTDYYIMEVPLDEEVQAKIVLANEHARSIDLS